MAISPLDEYLETIPDDDNRERMVDVLVWVGLTYPELELRIEWNQPMFTHHGTYIIGFSAGACLIVCVSVFCLKGLMHDE